MSRPTGLSSGSQRILSKGPPVSFLQRQAEHEQKCQLLKQSREARRSQEERQWFTPDIGRADEVLRKSGKDQLGESREARIHRMSVEAKTLAEQRRRRLENQLYGQYSYEP